MTEKNALPQAAPQPDVADLPSNEPAIDESVKGGASGDETTLSVYRRNSRARLIGLEVTGY